MAGSSSGWVAGLTAAALAAVGLLAYQASATAPADLRSGTKATGSASPSASAGHAGPGASGKPAKDPLALPPESGSGERVVYALADRRVWLVDEGGEVVRTFRVTPSAVSPAPGTYAVTSRSGAARGSDGVRVEHVVRFATVEGITVGFSAAVDDSTPRPDPVRRTGGVRMARADGSALWAFATINVKVVVVP
ncbi:L,D-transpeptidase [Streptomyces sp. MRC013]|uniref:L,D-transpeptidase n=1 Tax=Streptomyces sp. MRC013 TaxID=2898276 RepID=UPI0020270647|nr:L,D-transpeptidase [Streptomyces sp. MRC013]URM90011.1 L,D-transpeptidase [Streptomyces sp. MRC013]